LGIFGLISAVLSLGMLTRGFSGMISWLTLFVYAVVETALGFILGYSLIVKYVLSKNEKSAQKGEELLAKLLPLQGKLGLLGLIIGIWCIICSILYAVA
jgi:nicotinamide riboside transporter PnuC